MATSVRTQHTMDESSGTTTPPTPIARSMVFPMQKEDQSIPLARWSQEESCSSCPVIPCGEVSPAMCCWFFLWKDAKSSERKCSSQQDARFLICFAVLRYRWGSKEGMSIQQVINGPNEVSRGLRFQYISLCPDSRASVSRRLDSCMVNISILVSVPAREIFFAASSPLSFGMVISRTATSGLSR